MKLMMLEVKQKHQSVQMTKTRGKGKIGKVLGLSDSFKEFKKQNKDLNIDYKTYKSICADFNKASVDKILKDSSSFKLPYRLGKIRIQKKKMSFASKNKLSIDWVKSNKTGYRVYHLNDHRDNFRYKWYWEKKYINIPNETCYSFIATRTNKRDLARILLHNKDIDYFE